MKIHWIDVKKKLPADEKEYLVCGNNYCSEKKIGSAKFDPRSGWRGADFNNIFYWSDETIEFPEFEIEEEVSFPIESKPLQSYNSQMKEIGEILINTIKENYKPKDLIE